MSDSLFLYVMGILVITAEQIFAAFGWPCPGLVDKT